jgi:hypothetical protein
MVIKLSETLMLLLKVTSCLHELSFHKDCKYEMAFYPIPSTKESALKMELI